MAVKRPAPKTLSVDALNSIVNASAQQTGKAVRVRTYDPNFPLFDTPVNQKVLVYIPNHTVMGADGSVDIRKDKFAAHQTQEGKSFATVRCTAGIVAEELGLDGSCPLCDANTEVWDLYNREYKEIAKQKGIDPASAEAKDGLKQVRIDLLNKQVVKPGEVWYTFPIVVIDCDEKDGKLTTTPKKDSEGKISGKVMWYSIREKTYTDKWVKAFETAPTDDDITPTHPAGMWAVLNFEYDSKDGKHDKMGSARALAVGFKKMADSYNAWADYFDKLSDEWTPAKAMETLVDNALRDAVEQREVADTLLKPVRDKLAMYELSEGSISGQAQISAGSADANAALAGFGATQVPTGAPAGSIPQVPTGDVPQMGVN